MSYVGNGEVSASYRPEHSVERVTSRATEALLVATGSLTAGRYGLFRWDMKPRAGGPKPHFHRTYSEAFFILAGTVRVYDGAAWVDATIGDYLYVPEGGIHAFENVADAAASMLILFAPGAPREAYFRELAANQREGRVPSADELADLYARHDQTMV
jgi:mannose-6-phosphate isomerase-like protein (cupin superfamily)